MTDGRVFSLRLFAGSALLMGALLSGTGPAVGTGTDNSPRIAFEPAVVVAGKTLTAILDTGEPVTNAWLYHRKHKARFYPVGKNRWRALIGVPSTEKPGKKAATFYAEFSNGTITQKSVSFRVKAGQYPSSRVALSKKRNKLVSSGQLNRDTAQIKAIYENKTTAEKLWDDVFILPASGTVSSVFGARRAYGKSKKYTAHSGVDIANAEGTPIAAPNRGRVVFAQWLDSLGHTVVLDHGQGVFTYYVHMIKGLVSPNELVAKGAAIGLMGSEGVSTGPHLHWSMAVAGERVDPLEWTRKEFR